MRVFANVLNKQTHRAGKGLTSAEGNGLGANDPSSFKAAVL